MFTKFRKTTGKPKTIKKTGPLNRILNHFPVTKMINGQRTAVTRSAKRLETATGSWLGEVLSVRHGGESAQELGRTNRTRNQCCLARERSTMGRLERGKV